MIDDNKLYGLAFGCPFLERIENCPMKRLDELTFGEKYQLINKLSQYEKHKIFEKHINCSKNRT